MKKLIALLFCFCIGGAFASENKFANDEQNCKRAHSRVDALLQFLYKFEGNLPAVKPAKEKRLKYLISQFENSQLSEAVRRSAFIEYYYDHDYLQLSLQEKSLKLIKDLEELKAKSNPEIDKKLILDLPKVTGHGTYTNPYFKILKFTDLQNDVRNFFEELENTKTKLEQLKADDRLEKSLGYDHYQYGLLILLHKGAMTKLIKCNLDYFETNRAFK